MSAKSVVVAILWLAAGMGCREDLKSGCDCYVESPDADTDAVDDDGSGTDAVDAGQ